MKVKELSQHRSLSGIKVKTPTGVVGYWKSQWGHTDGKAGVWLSDGKSDRMYPQFINSLQDALEWECDIEDEVNCHELTDLEYTELSKEE